jgi:hypothetical protein
VRVSCGSGVGQADGFSQLDDAPWPSMAIDQNVDVDGLNVSGLYQGVQANDRQRQPISAAEVKRRACGRCHGNAADQGYFVVEQLIAVQGFLESIAQRWPFSCSA